MSYPRIFRIPFYTRFMMFFATILFGGISVYMFSDPEIFFGGYCFSVFALPSLIAFVWSLYTIKITDSNISITSFLMTKRLAWNEIEKIEHTEDGFSLKNHDEDVVLKVNSQVVGFFEVIEFVKERTPQVWSAKDVTEFHPGRMAWSGILLFGLSGAYMIFAALYGDTNGEENLLVRGLVFILGLLCIGFLFFVPLRVSIENEHLVILRLGRKQTLHVSDVESVLLQQTAQQNGYYYQVHVKLKNKKTLRLANFREGTFALATSLEKWMQKYTNPH